jgi:hypothetical protein
MPSPETIFPRFRDRFWSPAGDLLVLTENRRDAETGRNEADWTIVGVDGKREHRHSCLVQTLEGGLEGSPQPDETVPCPADGFGQSFVFAEVVVSRPQPSKLLVSFRDPLR